MQHVFYSSSKHVNVVWMSGWWIFLSIVPFSAQWCKNWAVCVCNSCRAVTYKPAEQVWKAWLALRNEAAPPTSSPPPHILPPPKPFFICHTVARANRLAQTSFQAFFRCFWCGSLEQNKLLPSHVAWFASSTAPYLEEYTHPASFLTETKPSALCQCKCKQELHIFNVGRGDSFIAPIVAKSSSKTLISLSISHAWQELRMVPEFNAAVSKEWERNHPDPQNLGAWPNLVLHQGYKAHVCTYQICEFLTRLTMQTVKHQMFSEPLRKASVDGVQHFISTVNSQVNECRRFYSRYPVWSFLGCCTSRGAKISLPASSRVDLSLVHV